MPTFLLIFTLLLATGAVSAWGEPETTPEAEAALMERLQAAGPGERVDASPLELSEKTIPMVDVTRTPMDGPVFLLSDKPEYFRTGDGIAMRERVEAGDVRFYSYHVPTPGTPEDGKAVVVLVENLGEGPLHIEALRHAAPPTGKDYHAIGKGGIVSFLSPDTDLPRYAPVPAGARAVLHRSLGGDNDLIHLWTDLRLDQPAEFTVFQTDADADPATVVDQLPELPQVLEGFHASGAGRGQFAVSNVAVSPADAGFVVRTSMGPQQIVLADGQRDPWIEGTDGLTGEATQNKGNYGVLYDLTIPWESDDGRGLAVLVYNARAGGKWCEKQATAFAVGDSPQNALPAGVVACPADAVRYGGPPEAVLVHRLHPTGKGEAGQLRITFTPPGASCLPAPLVLVPISGSATPGSR